MQPRAAATHMATRHLTRVFLIVLAVAAVALAIQLARSPTVGPTTSRATLAAAPVRAVLSFWRAARAGDASSAYRLLALRLRRDEAYAPFRRSLNRDRTIFARIPEAIRVSEHGPQATVSFVPTRGGLLVTDAARVVFRLSRFGAGWRIVAQPRS